MCMEDVKIGRATISGDGFATAGNPGPAEIVSASLDRYCLIFSPPIAGQVTLTLNPAGIASGQGIILPSGADPLVLTIQEHGDLVRRAWYGVGDAAARVVGFAYCSLVPV